MDPEELARGQALDIQEADDRGQQEQGDQAPTLKIELAVSVERSPAQPLDDHDHDPAAVESEQGQQVREPERNRQQRDQEDVGRRPLVDRLCRDRGNPDRSCKAAGAEQPSLDLPRDERIQALDDPAHGYERERDPVAHSRLNGDQPAGGTDTDLTVTRGRADGHHRHREAPTVGMAAGQHERRAWRSGILDLRYEARGCDRLAVRGLDAVARQEPSLRGRRTRHHADDLARVVIQLGQPEPGHEQDRHDEVGDRPARQDCDPLQRRLGVETTRIAEISGLHPAHTHVTEDWQRANRVKRSAARERQHLGAGPDRELDHAHFEQLREEEMAGFVRRDQEEEHPRDTDYDQEVIEQSAHALSLPELAFTYSLAQRSASRISCSVSPPPGKAERARSTIRMIALNGLPPARNAFTASSLAAFSPAGCPAPTSAASRASLTLGNLFSSSAWNSRPLSSSSEVAGTASARRSG